MLDAARPRDAVTAPPGSGPARPPAAALVAVAVLIAMALAAWLVERPPAPSPTDSPPSEFSADRAWRHLEAIVGDEPTPIGSPGGDAVRDHLVAELSALGLQTEVQRGMGARTFGANVEAGRVENVVATLPGAASTGRLVVAAHYDTVFGSPGASDDKASVAAILEAARALAGGPPLRNDIVLLLSDGEEPGMLGAAAYVDQNDLSGRPGVLLNWEGPGNGGPSAVFQSSAGAAGIIDAFAQHAPYPVGDSMIPGIFHLLPNNTDLTVLDEAGYEGLTLGFSDGRAYYHSPQDTLANLDRAGLQHHGANLLAMTRGLGDADLASLRSDADQTFFTLFGVVIHYPNLLVWPLAVLAGVAVAGVGLLARLRGIVTVPQLLAGAAVGLLPLVVGVFAAAGLWELLVILRPGYDELYMGEPYRPGFYRWALGALAVTIVTTWFLALRGRIGAPAMTIGALLWHAALGVGMAGVVPGMSFYGSLSALAAATGVLAAVLLGERHPHGRLIAVTAGAAPGVLLLLSGGRTMLQGMGLSMGMGGILFFTLAGLLVLPLLMLVVPAGGTRRAHVLLPATAFVAACALAGAGLAVDRFDAAHPRSTHLMYVLDADVGAARWLSTDAEPHDWVAAYAPQRVADPVGPLPYRVHPAWTGPVEAAPMAAPELTVMEKRPDGDTEVVELLLVSARDADVLTLHADRPVESVNVVADGYPPVIGTPDHESTQPWPMQLHVYDPPAEGVRVQLRLEDADGLRLMLGDYTTGLTDLPGFRPRPTDLVRDSEHDAELVVVTRRYVI